MLSCSTLLVLGYCVISSTMSLVNKNALLEFPHPNLLVFMQYTVAAVALAGASGVGVFSIKSVSWQKLQGVGVSAFFFHLGIWSGSQVMYHSNVDTFIAFRGCVPLVVAVLEQCLLSLTAKPLNVESTISLCAIFSCSVGFGLADDKFNVAAYSWGTFATLTIATEILWVKRLFDTNDISFWELSLLNNSMSAAYALSFEVARLCIGLSSELHDVDVSSAIISWPVWLSSFAGIVMSVLAFAVRQELSATSFSVLGVGNKFLTIAFNSLVWAHHSSTRARVLLGLGIFATVTYQQSLALPAQKSDQSPISSPTWTRASAVMILLVALGVTASSHTSLAGLNGGTFALSQEEPDGEILETGKNNISEDSHQTSNEFFTDKSGKRITGDSEADKLDSEIEENSDHSIAEGLAAESNNDEEPVVKSKVLVILYGRIRGDRVMHSSLLYRLLEPWNADLALLAPITSETPLVKGARYVWNVSDVDDWHTHLSDIKNSQRVWANACSKQVTKKVRRTVNKGSGVIRGPVYLGGVGQCAHANSKQGFNLVFRHLAQKFILQNNVQEVYDWIVFTRSDFLYLCDVPPLDTFSRNCVTVPYGQDFGGFNDRFHIIPNNLVIKALNIATDLVENWDVYGKRPCSNSFCNIEGAIARHFGSEHIQVCRFQNPGVLVHAERSGMRHVVKADRSGKDSKHLQSKGYLVKYPEEIKHARSRCGQSAKFDLEL